MIKSDNLNGAFEPIQTIRQEIVTTGTISTEFELRTNPLKLNILQKPYCCHLWKKPQYILPEPLITIEKWIRWQWTIRSRFAWRRKSCEVIVENGFKWLNNGNVNLHWDCVKKWVTKLVRPSSVTRGCYAVKITQKRKAIARAAHYYTEKSYYSLGRWIHFQCETQWPTIKRQKQIVTVFFSRFVRRVHNIPFGHTVFQLCVSVWVVCMLEYRQIITIDQLENILDWISLFNQMRKELMCTSSAHNKYLLRKQNLLELPYCVNTYHFN